jgi:hypothetical protein
MCKSRNKKVEDHKKRGKPHVKMVESRAKRRITHSKMRTLGFVPFLMEALAAAAHFSAVHFASSLSFPIPPSTQNSKLNQVNIQL